MGAAGYPLPDLSSIVEALERREEGLAVGGVVPAARPLVLAALARASWPRRRTVVVVPHPSEARDLVAALALLAPELRTAAASAETASPYQGAEPPLAARLELVSLLDRIAGDGLDLVAVPARALLAPIPEPARVAEAAVRLEVGRRLDSGELAARLVAAGYRRVDLVEEAGEVAVRGWVVDLHPGGEQAFRLRLDDDLLAEITPFDPGSQRSCGDPCQRLRLLPVDPFPATPERRATLAAALEASWPSLAALVREGAEAGLWWGARHLAGGATSWLELGEALVVCDLDEALGELGRSAAVQERERETLARRSVSLPPPAELLLDRQRLAAALEAEASLRVERLELAGGTTRWWRLATHPMESYARRIPDLVPAIRRRRGADLAQLLVVASEGEERRFAHLLSEGGVAPVPPPSERTQVAIERSPVEHGFVWDGGLAVYGRRDLSATPRPRPRRRRAATFVSDLRDLRSGDLVVHVDHGIGRFDGFRRVEVEGRLLETLVVAYQGGDTLMVPVERADLIQKYAAGDRAGTPRLDRLGGTSWTRRTARVRKAVREMAAELLRLAAMRHAAPGHAFSPDSPWQREFEDAFEHELTSDQERALAELKADMEAPQPMDRLLCGDVGYGKTEVALRAAFKAVLDGKQVGLLAPTTILVGQHLETFRRRLAGFPVEARMLSRFVGQREAREVLEGLADGTVDIVVGTHRMLARDVRFRDLGLVIIDEEQRFGVAQKERLKRLRAEVDVLAMSATPIPRTLNMALSGLRDVSIIETPPRDRQAVETTVLSFSEEIVREAILHEAERGGQVFVVHNRVRSIGALAEWLRRTVPEVEVVVAHGQMSERTLERSMRRFVDGEAEVLLATAIIENGLDIPNANTLLVNRADRFGLAQLYQLRGRVGRSERLAYAYFLVPPGHALSTTARARLAAIQEFCELGAGFRIAARDLEIRGAGNILGAEQHGFLEAVGFETYCKLLEEAVAELEGAPSPRQREVELSLGLDLQLPEGFIPEPSLRLSFYKRLAACDDEGPVAELIGEIVDRYGPPPTQLEALATAQRLRIAARRAGVVAVVRRDGRWHLRLDRSLEPSPRLADAAAASGAQVTPEGELVLDAAHPASEVLVLLDRLAS